jgi:hypothetical protein
MTSPRFGDRVRIAIAPETEASGFAGRVGEVWSESPPSVANLGPVIGDRGEGLALSVLFEDGEDPVWFAPHLVKRVDRVASRSRLMSLLFVAAFALPIATAIPGVARSAVHGLAVVSAATPCFPVQGYVTSGVYPAVRGRSWRVVRTNIMLRRAVIADQQRYAPSARRETVPNVAGIYETAIDPELLSASTAVVSALIPARELYPGGNDGQTWISATIDVRTGRLVALRELLANPQLALMRLVRDWKARLRGSERWPGVAAHPADYTPTLAHYRHFALTPRGLSFGFPQEPAGSRLAVVLPYRLVHPYLSPFGRRLVAGVRRPRLALVQRQHVFSWTPLRGFSPAVAGGWPLACTY